MLKAVIFDLDGVLVATDHLHYQGWKRIADQEGLHFDETINHRLLGVSREESLRRIYEHNKRPLPAPEDFQRLCTEKNEIYKELVQAMDSSCVLQGALEILEELRAANIRTAVSSASKNAPLVLERTGLKDRIDVLVDGSSVERSKPAPDGFLAAAEKCGVDPCECVGIEDAAAGIEAILAAGMVAIGIGPQARERAHLSVSSVDDLNLTLLKETLGSKLSRFRS